MARFALHCKNNFKIAVSHNGIHAVAVFHIMKAEWAATTTRWERTDVSFSSLSYHEKDDISTLVIIRFAVLYSL